MGTIKKQVIKHKVRQRKSEREKVKRMTLSRNKAAREANLAEQRARLREETKRAKERREKATGPGAGTRLGKMAMGIGRDLGRAGMRLMDESTKPKRKRRTTRRK